MPTPATKQDLKAFFDADLKPHFNRKVEEVKTYVHKEVADLKTHVSDEIESAHAATADEIAEVNAKLDRLLTDARVQRLEHRMSQLEHAIFGKPR